MTEPSGPESSRLGRCVYRVAQFTAWLIGRVLWGVRTEGHENVPQSGPVIVAVSHESVLDPVIVGAEIHRRLRYLARNTLFGPRGEIRLHGKFLQMLGAVPIERDGGGARETIRLALGLLEQGEAVLIFPEGTRSADGSLGRFRRGVGLMARAAGCPVLPVSLDGSRRLWRRGRKLPRLFGGPVLLRIGATVSYDKTTRAEDVAADLRDRILGLRGPRDEMPAGDGAGSREATGGSPSV